MVICKEIDDYLKYVKEHPKWINKKRKQLIKNIVKPLLKRNDIFFDKETYENCLEYCKVNYYELFPYQKFIYAFVFMYKDDIPVFPKFFIKEGRGNGKDGFIVPLVNFMQTPLYGVRNYHVEIVANSEDQVKDTFKVAYDMLHENAKFKGKFSVTKELITNLATGSEMKYNTSNAKTKDGKRTGCLVLNEIHAYENYDQINVFESSFGKVKHSREFIITTDGYVRDGPLDEISSMCAEILETGENPLRNLSQEEKNFYEGFKDIKQSITANQIDIIPTEIIDRTLDDVKKASPILKLVNMAPANVKKWIVASHTGAAVWGALTDSVKGELSTEISALNIDLHMLTAYLVIPKAIRELSLEFVDRYFMAILSEAMQDGLVKGYLDGDGKTGPIGIFRQIGTSNSDGTNKAKTVVTNITKFSPKGLSDVRKTLTNNGKRVVDKLYLICNPSDEAEYVDPCMYGEALTGGYVNKSFIDIEKIVDANCPKGKAAFTIAGYYTMGTTGVRVNEYDQTKAMENADLIIASCYANGRAVDDNVAVIFDVTKLEEYVLPVTQATIVKAGQE